MIVGEAATPRGVSATGKALIFDLQAKGHM